MTESPRSRPLSTWPRGACRHRGALTCSRTPTPSCRWPRSRPLASFVSAYRPVRGTFEPDQAGFIFVRFVGSAFRAAQET
ncbi:MAG: hypothetical protein RLN75_05530 [Longimicrobiales bacterium]